MIPPVVYMPSVYDYLKICSVKFIFVVLVFFKSYLHFFNLMIIYLFTGPEPLTPMIPPVYRRLLTVTLVPGPEPLTPMIPPVYRRLLTVTLVPGPEPLTPMIPPVYRRLLTVTLVPGPEPLTPMIPPVYRLLLTVTLVPGPEPLTPMIPPVGLQAVVNSDSCSRSRAPHPNDPSSRSTGGC